MEEIRMVEERREQILNEMRQMRAMRKGSVTEQYLKVRSKGAKKPALRGPYWVYTRKEKGKTVGQRLSRKEAERFGKEVEGYHRFQALCSEYAELTERLGELEREQGEETQEKKGRKSPSNRTPK